MRRILYVLASLEYGGAARQATLLARGLPRDQFRAEVCVLGKLGPWRDDLAQGGVVVTALGWKRWLDLRPFLRLRERIRVFQPDVIHAYTLPALRAVMAASAGLKRRLVVSAPWPRSKQSVMMTMLDRWILHRANKVLAGGPYESRVCRAVGLSAEQIAEVAPGVALDPSPAPSPSLRETLGLSPRARLIACVGPLDPDKGLKNAVWALDILRYLFDDLHLAIIGVGGDQPRVHRFAQAAKLVGKVHFLGTRPDVPSLLTQVDIVWVHSQGNTGINAALEGMAAGRPVVASSRPVLADLIRNGETGILVPPKDQGALARQTRLLLEDSGRRRKLGEAAQKHVQDRHHAASLVKRCARLYEDVAV
jgi:glycosyltransferase involved in cell wall biosynthesis